MTIELQDALTAIGIGNISPTYKGARVVKSANQTIPANTNTALTWASASRDTNGFWSSGAPTRLTVPAGVTKVRLRGSYWTHDSSVSQFGCFFWKNGAAVEGSASLQTTGGNWAFRSVGSDVIDCVAGDYFEFVVFITGTGIDVWPGTDTWFALEVVQGSILDQTPVVLGGSGSGVPSGGSVRQILVKQSSANGDAVWTGIGDAIIGTAGAHTYWRIKYISGNHGSFLSAYDIQFRQKAGVTAHPTGGTILEAHTRAGFAASDAFDANDTTRWALDDISNIASAYLGYQYSSPVSVVQVRMLCTNGETPNSYNIQYSDDGVTWTTVLAVTGQTVWTGEVLHNLPTTGTYGLPSPTAAAAHLVGGSLTYSKNCTMTNPATGIYKFTFDTPIADHCVPSVAATFNNDAADDTGMYCSFSRSTARSDDVTWVNSITVMTRRHTDGTLLAPQNLRLIMLDPTV